MALCWFNRCISFCRFIQQINGTNKTSMTYGHVLSTSRALARGLQHLGMRCGDNMLTCAYNSCHMVCLMLGALELGAVVTTINPVATKCENTLLLIKVDKRFGVINRPIGVSFYALKLYMYIIDIFN